MPLIGIVVPCILPLLSSPLSSSSSPRLRVSIFILTDFILILPFILTLLFSPLLSSPILSYPILH